MQCLVQTVNCWPSLLQLILFPIETEWVLKTKHIQNEKKCKQTRLPPSSAVEVENSSTRKTEEGDKYDGKRDNE
jgi:hypothetical protein